MEERFNQNLTAREVSAKKRQVIGHQFVNSLQAYDIHISDFTVPAESAFCGKTLSQINIRQDSGVSIVRIVRGGIFTNIPGGGKHIYPGDQIVVAGTDEQIDRFRQMLDSSVKPNTEYKERRTQVALENFTIEAGHPLIGQTIMDSGIRDKARCIVMGIQRNGQYIMNPEPSLTFQQDDMVLVAGETERLRTFLE